MSRPILAAALAALAACGSQPTPAPAPAPAAAPAPSQPQSGQAAAPRRARPTPLQLDSARQRALAGVRERIAGRENEPAHRVFRNVKVLRHLTAGQLLATMDEQFGRGLGVGCGSCHVMTDLADDSRKNKKVARQMQQMQDRINTRELPRIRELGDEFDRVSCVTCHRGSEHPANTMAVPGAPAAPPAR